MTWEIEETREREVVEWEIAEHRDIEEMRRYVESRDHEAQQAVEFASVVSAIVKWGRENAPEMAEEIEAETEKAAAEVEAWCKAAADGNHIPAESHRDAAKRHADAAFAIVGSIAVTGRVKAFEEIFWMWS